MVAREVVVIGTVWVVASGVVIAVVVIVGVVTAEVVTVGVDVVSKQL